jgi:hypothetical protein
MLDPLAHQLVEDSKGAPSTGGLPSMLRETFPQLMRILTKGEGPSPRVSSAACWVVAGSLEWVGDVRYAMSCGHFLGLPMDDKRLVVFSLDIERS